MKRIAILAILAIALSGCENGNTRANAEATTVVIVCIEPKGMMLSMSIDASALRDLPDHEVASRREIYRGAVERYSGKQNVISGEDGNFCICYEVTTRRKANLRAPVSDRTRVFSSAPEKIEPGSGCDELRRAAGSEVERYKPSIHMDMIATMRCVDLPDADPRAAVEKCRECGAAVWLYSDSRKVIQRQPGIPIVCIPCVRKMIGGDRE